MSDFWGESGNGGGFWGNEGSGRGRGGSRSTTVDLPVRAEPPARRPGRGRRPRRARRLSGAVTVMALLILVASLGGGGYFGYTELMTRLGAPDYSGRGSGNVTIEVVKDDYTADVGQTLVEADVVKSVKAFVQAAGNRLEGLQPGFYGMRRQMSAAAAVALLLDPKSRTGVVDVPPGKWASEIYARLSKATGIPVAKFKKVDPRSLGLPAAAEGRVEGYLYPGRYDLPPDATAAQLLKMMVSRFKQEVGNVDFGRGEDVGLTPSEVVTVASLIEAEAGRPEDYRKISRVIQNRLEDGMRIQFDTALLYAWQKRTLDVRERHQGIKSPYNLYLHDGLPPGPIGSPSVAAIEAALNPAKGKWLYFVATDPDKRLTEYAVSYKDFLKLKAKFEKWLEDNPQPRG
ncbi:endolytic transglycosylase MltG [Actinocorallia sp. B10E7]|uniref:endolytic transglycosylase MltG n=1 Tax=Actinocorallia sp. B10E7 TaxID=3153558 RepID=UPI00325D4BA3